MAGCPAMNHPLIVILSLYINRLLTEGRETPFMSAFWHHYLLAISYQNSADKNCANCK